MKLFVILYKDGSREECVCKSMKKAEAYATSNSDWCSITYINEAKQ